MRISANKRDHAYRPSHITARAIVMLDGRELRNVHTADEGLGEVRCYAYPFRLDTTRTRLQELVLRGDVKIVFRETP